MTGVNQCSACGSTDVDESLDEIGPICTECGAVINERENIPSDTPRDSFEIRDEISDTTDWTERYTVHNSTQKNVATALELLEELADVVSLSEECRREGAELFVKVTEVGLTDGRPTRLTIAAVLYITCRNTGEPRPMAEFAEFTDKSKGQIDMLARLIQRELDLEQPICSPDEYVPRLGEKLGLDESTVEKASSTLYNVEGTQSINGKNPAGIAGAALYLVASDRITQREVAMESGVTKETIRLRLHDLRGILNE